MKLTPEQELEMYKRRCAVAETVLKFLRDSKPYKWSTIEFLHGHIQKAILDGRRIIEDYEDEY